MKSRMDEIDGAGSGNVHSSGVPGERVRNPKLERLGGQHRVTAVMVRGRPDIPAVDSVRAVGCPLRGAVEDDDLGADGGDGVCIKVSTVETLVGRDGGVGLPRVRAQQIISEICLRKEGIPSEHREISVHGEKACN